MISPEAQYANYDVKWCSWLYKHNVRYLLGTIVSVVSTLTELMLPRRTWNSIHRAQKMIMKRPLTKLWIGRKRKTRKKNYGKGNGCVEQSNCWCTQYMICSRARKMVGLYKAQAQRVREVMLTFHRRNLSHRNELLFVLPERYSHCDDCGIWQEGGEGEMLLSVLPFLSSSLRLPLSWVHLEVHRASTRVLCCRKSSSIP